MTPQTNVKQALIKHYKQKIEESVLEADKQLFEELLKMIDE